jgi:hypothetical protein
MLPKTLSGFGLIALMVAGPLQARQTNPTSEIPADGRILGVVVDDANKPVSGALVMLGDGRSTETGADGSFSFVRVRPGANEIAAVTKSCWVASGGFDVAAGRDARLQLIVMPQGQGKAGGEDRSRGTPTRRITSAELLEIGDHTALEAIDELAAGQFVAAGSLLAVRTRAVSPRGDVIEPLLLVDGVRIGGHVAEVLRSIRAADVESIDIHLGSAAGWEFQNGGSPAVIELRMRNKPVGDGDPFENPAMCLRKGR